MTAGWHRAIAWALTGEDLPLPEQDVPDLDALVEQLAAAGWPASRIVASAGEARAAGIWPVPVPARLRAGLGAAQLHAAIREARLGYGLEAGTAVPPSRRTTLTADERRLLGEVPPHY